MIFIDIIDVKEQDFLDWFGIRVNISGRVFVYFDFEVIFLLMIHTVMRFCTAATRVNSQKFPDLFSTVLTNIKTQVIHMHHTTFFPWVNYMKNDIITERGDRVLI